MTDVHRRRERAAEERADDRADAVRKKDGPEVVAVTGRRRALDVVHSLGEVVDAEGDGRGQERRDIAQPAQDLGSGPGQVDSELGERVTDGLRIEAVPAEYEVRQPA